VFLLGERGIAVSIIRVDVGVSGRRAAWWQQTLFGVVERSYYNFSSLASRVCYRFSEVLFLLLRRILYKAADTCGASSLDWCFEVLVGELLL
jgi:hypothetical protein